MPAGDSRDIKRLDRGPSGPARSTAVTPAVRWEVGQVLRGTATRGTPPGRGGGQARLRISGRELAVRSQVPIYDGDQITLSLDRIHPQATLRLIEVNGRPPDAEKHALRRWRAQRLQRQLGWQGLLVLARASAAVIDKAWRPAWLTLRQALPRPAQLTTGAGLRQAVRNGGLWLETRLLKRHDCAADLKGQLLQLQPHLPPAIEPQWAELPAQAAQLWQALQTQPPRCALWTVPAAAVSAEDPQAMAWLGEPGMQSRLLAGVLARLELGQILNWEMACEQTLPGWLVELPVLDAPGDHVLALSVVNERAGEADGTGARWALQISLALPELGPLWARLSVTDKLVSVVIWVTTSAVQARVQQALCDLRGQLTALGLAVDQLSCQVGEPDLGYAAGEQSLDVQA